MDQTTHEIRLANWKTIIDQCLARPKDQMSIPLEKCSLFGVSLHPIPEKEASHSGTECRVFMSKN